MNRPIATSRSPQSSHHARRDVADRSCRWREVWLLVILAIVGFYSAGVVLGADEPIKKSFGLGPVKATVQLEPAEPVIGDTLTLTLTVVAEKDVELLMPEFGEALERFSILDFVPRQSIDDQGRTVATQTYRLEPPSSGPHAIPPILIEFVDRREGRQPAPEGQDAYELLTERIDFKVQSVLPDDAQADLKPPLGQAGTAAHRRPIAMALACRWGHAGRLRRSTGVFVVLCRGGGRCAVAAPMMSLARV